MAAGGWSAAWCSAKAQAQSRHSALRLSSDQAAAPSACSVPVEAGHVDAVAPPAHLLAHSLPDSNIIAAVFVGLPPHAIRDGGVLCGAFAWQEGRQRWRCMDGLANVRRCSQLQDRRCAGLAAHARLAAQPAAPSFCLTTRANVDHPPPEIVFALLLPCRGHGASDQHQQARRKLQPVLPSADGHGCTRVASQLVQPTQAGQAGTSRGSRGGGRQRSPPAEPGRKNPGPPGFRAF